MIETDGSHFDRFKAPYAGEYGAAHLRRRPLADRELRRLGQRRFRPLSRRGGRPRRGRAAEPATLRHRTPQLRHAPQPARLLGDRRQRRLAPRQQLLRQLKGFSTDVFTAPGHPGFPQDSDLLEHNNFYDNNFNSYLPECEAGQKPGPSGPNQGCSDVTPTEPVPVGTGMWIAGGNANVVRNNRFYDNWRRGAMLFAVPDAFVCDDPDNQVAGCDPTPARPRQLGHLLPQQVLRQPDGTGTRREPSPNGVDFWWDQGGIIVDTTPGYTSGNYWYSNTGSDGTAASVTGVPSPSGAAPDNLPFEL